MVGVDRFRLLILSREAKHGTRDFVLRVGGKLPHGVNRLFQ